MKKRGNGSRPKRGRGRALSLEELYYRQGGRCCYCHMPTVLGGNDFTAATRDHITPRSQGGKQAGNLKMACRRCNQTRGSADATAFKRTLVGENGAV